MPIEWSLFVERTEELESLVDESFGRIVLDGSPAEIRYGRIYIGAERTENSLPSLEQIDRSMLWAAGRGLSLTLVTPSLTDVGVEALMEILDFVSIFGGFSEIVVNDWGVLKLVRDRYEEFTPVLGTRLSCQGGPDLYACAADLSYFPCRRFLWNYGVRRIELSESCLSVAAILDHTGLRISVHMTLSPVTDIPRGESAPLHELRTGTDFLKEAVDGGVDRFVVRYGFREEEDVARNGTRENPSGG